MSTPNAQQNQTTEVIEADLRELAAQADAGVDFEDGDLSAQEEADRAASGSENSEQSNADKAKEKPEGGAKEGDETDAEKKGDQESEKSKYAKERERKDRSWESLNAEKEQVRKDREELERERQELQSRRQQAEQPVESKDDKGFTASDYDAAAKTFRDRGDDDLAEAAEKQAKDLREADQRAAGEGQHRKFLDTWHKAVSDEIKARPELADESHALSVAVQKLLKEDEVFSRLPDGFKRAVEIASLRIQAASVPSLTEQVATLQKEIDRLNGERQPGGSGPTSKPKAKTFDQLTPDEQDAELRRQAEEADAQGVAVVTP
jgi:hypothetical protein